MGSKKPNSGVLKAVEVVGGQEQLAQKLGVKQPMIHHYIYRNCPAERAVQIEEMTGVTREEIRPDLFLIKGKRKK